MDPNETLRLLRELLAEFWAAYEEDDGFQDVDDIAADIANHFESLDEWLKKGGCLPKEWTIDQTGRNG